MQQDQLYTGENIRVLKGLEAVRKRPGMYVGGTDEAALHHCLYELLDNSVDEALGGHCDQVTVTLHTDGSVSVEDNGRGIPVDIHPTEKQPTATVVLTQLHAGGKFDSDAYEFSGGLNGVGAACANGLSKKFEVNIQRDGYAWHQTFLDGGNPEAPLAKGGTSSATGTRIRFWPDDTIFDEGAAFNPDTIISRLKFTAFLAPGLTLRFVDELNDKSPATFHAKGFSEILDVISSHCGDPVSELLSGDSREDIDGEGAVEASVVLRWHARNSVLKGFANTIPNDDGTHLTGFRKAVTKALNDYAHTNNLLRASQSLTQDDTQGTLAGAVCVRLADPRFSNQTKTRLSNPSMQGVVSRLTRAVIDRAFEENPAMAKTVIEHAKLMQKKREAEQRAGELVVSRKSVIARTALPGKLADCRGRA